MANEGGNVVPRITKAEHIGPDDTGDNIHAKRVAGYVWNSDANEWQRAAPGATAAKQDDIITAVTNQYDRIAGLTFNQTVLAGATYTTAWVATNSAYWLRIMAHIPDTSIFSGTISVSTAVDPDSPAAGDIEDSASITLAGDSLGGISKASFNIPGGQKWAKISVTNATASTHIIKVVTDYTRIAPSAAILPLVATLNKNYGATIVRSILAAQKTNGTYSNVVMTNDGLLKTSISEATADVPIKALTSLQITRVTVGTTAVRIDPSALAGRKTVAVKAITGTGEIVYVGHSSAVTTGNGWPLGNSDSIELEIDDTQQVWAIASAASQSVALSEVA